MFNSMFDEWKEAKYFKKITDFRNLKMQNTSKEIKRLKSFPKAEAYLEPKRATTMKLVLWIYLKADYFRNKSSIVDIRMGLYRPLKILKFSKWS